MNIINDLVVIIREQEFAILFDVCPAIFFVNIQKRVYDFPNDTGSRTFSPAALIIADNGRRNSKMVCEYARSDLKTCTPFFQGFSG